MDRRQRGFTYIESGVILLVIMLLAALIVPNLVADRDRREVRVFRQRLVLLAGQAHTKAIETGSTVALSYDRASHSINANVEDTTQGLQKLRKLPIPERIVARRLAADRNESPADGWRVPFFADGSSTGGGIEFADDGRIFSLLVRPSDVRAIVLDTPLPDLGADHWPAGNLSARG